MDSSTPQTTVQPYPILQISPSCIAAHVQIRRHFDAGSLQELADSIRDHGLVQPIVVRSEKIGVDILYTLIAGERRWRAAKIAGVETIPAIVRDDLDPTGITVMQAIENLQRENLTLPEICEGVSALVKSIGLAETCKRLHKSKPWVSKRANVLDMPEPVRNLIAEGLLKDVEIAGTLSEIQRIDSELAEELIDAVREPDEWERPLSRESVRADLKRAQERIERQQQAALDDEKRKAQQAGREKSLDAEAKKRKERERLIARVKTDRKDLRTALLASLRKSQGYSEKDMSGWNEAVRLDYAGSDFGDAYSKKFPVTAEACAFAFTAQGDTKRLGALLLGFAKKPLIDVHVPSLTLAQAQALERALADVDGLHMKFSTNATGKELLQVTDMLSKIAGKPAPTAKPAAKPKTVSPEKQGQLCVGQFLAECVERGDKTAKIKASELHGAYVAWCKRKKLTALAFNDNAWGDAIIAAGIAKVRSNGIRYIGCKLKGR